MSRAASHFRHEMIRASAGTGKTFQLTNRFLGLALDGFACEQILASTFTRKAAGEILERFLLRLAEAARDERTCEKLANAIKRPALTPQRCQELLVTLTRNLHRLRVCTLDSFFMQIAASFGFELGLPPGWRIVEDLTNQKIRDEAIRNLLREEADQAVGLMHLLSKGTADRSVCEQIRTLVDRLYGRFLDTTPEVWQAVPRPKRLRKEELQGAIDELAQFALPAGQWDDTRQKDLAKFHESDWEGFLGKGLAAKVFLGEATFNRKPISAELAAAYAPLIAHAKAELLHRLADQTEATRSLLEKFDKHFEQLKQAQLAFRFDDIARKLAQGALGDRLQHVDFRLDASLSHLLLDEFQDTSLVQWSVMRPFAQQVIDGANESRSFFCVGDVKQAIYGWRGGSAEIFKALDKDFTQLQESFLDQSYRSAQEIVDVVNRVFEKLPDNAALSKDVDAATSWCEGFKPHSTVRSELTGYCRLETAPADDLRPQKEVTLEHAAKLVKQLVDEAPEYSVGVLVRDNWAVARLIYELRKLNVPSSEEGGNPLTDSPAVTVVLSLLKLADHPGDTICRFHVAQSPLGAVVGLKTHDDDAAARRLSVEIRRMLLNAGYGSAIFSWVRALAPSCDARDLRRLRQLVELSYRYEPDATLRVRDFVDFVSQQRVEDPTTAQVRVMTVHQAKGLQFDLVVLPQLDKRLIGEPPSLVAGRPHISAPIDCVSRYANETVRAMLSDNLRKAFLDQRSQVVNEALSLLYVAMTRAVHALHIVIAPSAKNERSLPATFAGIVRGALTDGKPAAPQKTLYEHGPPDWFHRSGAKPPAAEAPPSAAAETKPTKVILARSEVRTRALDRRSPSGLEGGARVNLRNRLRLDTATALNKGTVFHAWLETIEWLDDWNVDNDALREIARQSGAVNEEIEAFLPQFHGMLKVPAIRAAMSQETYLRPEGLGFASNLAREISEPGVQWMVWRERGFAIRDGNHILNGNIDRVVLYCRGDKFLAADVLDFKTDNVPADNQPAIEERVLHYQPQLAAYRRALSRLTGLPLEKIKSRLLLLGPGIVCAVE